MFWDSGWKHCSNMTVRSSRLLFQDTFSSTIAISLWQFEQRGQSFLLQNSYFCYSFTNFSFLTVFHVSILSSVLPVQLPLFMLTSLIEGPDASHPWAFNAQVQCSVVPTLLPLLRPHLTPLDAGVRPKDLHRAHGVALTPSLPQQPQQRGWRPPSALGGGTPCLTNWPSSREKQKLFILIHGHPCNAVDY